MKRLTRIKLRNWHYFTNEDIYIDGSALITGDNASGKSTILDAVQYVLVGDQRQMRFNYSADEDSKRTLIDYVKGKTGVDERGARYLRNGNFSTVVALEFYEESKDKYFVIGSCIDCYSDNSCDNDFFKIEDAAIEDSMFWDGEKVRDRKNLRDHLKLYNARVYQTPGQYRQDLLMKLGSLSERFFDNLVRALAFKPLKDLKEFVYQYVLDEKKITIEAMRENFRRYKDYEKMAEDTKVQIGRLDEILSMGGELKRQRDRADTQEYIIKRAAFEISNSKLDGLKEEKQLREKDLKAAEKKLEKLKEQQDKLSAECDTLKEMLSQNENYRLQMQLQKEIGLLESGLKDDAFRINRARSAAKGVSEKLETVMEQGYLTDIVPFMDGLRTFADSKGYMDTDGLKIAYGSVRKQTDDVSVKIYGLGQELEGLAGREKELKAGIESLRDKRMVYDRNVTALRQEIADRLRSEKGVDVTPDILCELLEVKDERWRDAVEGYLNTQRFDLIVPAEYFNFSLNVYERFKKEKDIYGVGLVDTTKILKHGDNMEEGTLAEEVETQNPYARAYVNRIMGRLKKCEDVDSLNRYDRAITPTCMTYQNNVARQINFAVYRTPFIGSKAAARQLEMKQGELKAVQQDEDRVNAGIDKLGAAKDGMKAFDDFYYAARDINDVIDDAVSKRVEITERNEKLQSLDMNEYITIQEKLERALKDKRAADEEVIDCSDRRGGYKFEIKNLEENAAREAQSAEVYKEDLDSFAGEHSGITEAAGRRYEDETSKRDVPGVLRNFEISRKGLDTQIANQKTAIELAMQKYNGDFNFWGKTDAYDLSDYEEFHKKLRESRLEEYEEKIETARKEAEEEFKEHFIASLKENIDTAGMEFDMLNDALRGLEFGGDSYRFVVKANPQYKNFYDMIMDPLLMEGFNLFSDAFEARHKEAMDELFERITTDSEEEFEKVMAELTDYRNYLTYDIDIRHSDGQVSSFSKVSREKSGGETQTPYYVVMTASFIQMYKGKNWIDSIGLMLFDEAFNKMDSERIEATLRFMDSLGLQVILAAPTEKCEYIAPLVGTVALVMREGSSAWVSGFDYKREKANEVR